MNISKELLEKAKTAKSAEELLEMAKAENIELSAEQAAKAFAELNKAGELSDEELDNAAGGGCGSAYTDAAGDKGTFGVVGNSVFIYGDIYLIQSALKLLAGYAKVSKVDEHKVVVGAAGNHIYAKAGELFCHCFGIFNYLLGIIFKLGFERFAEANSLCGDNVLKRAALSSGEDSFIYLLGKLFFAKDHTAAGPAQGFVGGGGNNIGIGNGGGMCAAGNKSRDVGHINKKICADFLGDVCKFCKINYTGIGGSACDYHLGLVLKGKGTNLFVIDITVLIKSVGYHIVVFAREVYGRTVGKVSAAGKAHAENGIAYINKGVINSLVCLCAGMRLNVGMIGAKQLAGTAAGDILNDIYILAAAVITLSGITLGVFVGEDRTHCSQYCGRNDIFACDKLDVAALAKKLQLHCIGNLAVIL